MALALAGAIGLPLSARAADNPSNSALRKSHSSTVRRSTRTSSAQKATRKSSTKRRAYRRSVPYKYRLARLKLQPERITEIQQALTKNGYLTQEPSGKWDDATRAAMLRFQKEHGFPATGLPEAKSLMKLGLGPHELPQELDPAAKTPEQPGSGAATPSESNSSTVSPAPQ